MVVVVTQQNQFHRSRSERRVQSWREELSQLAEVRIKSTALYVSQADYDQLAVHWNVTGCMCRLDSYIFILSIEGAYNCVIT